MANTKMIMPQIGFGDAARFGGKILTLKIEAGETKPSEWISFRHWQGMAMMARRSQGGRGSTWDVIYDGSIFPGVQQIEYQTLDTSGWYASWLGNGFYHVRGDGSDGHPDEVIRYLSSEPDRYGTEAVWNKKKGVFDITRLD